MANTEMPVTETPTATMTLEQNGQHISIDDDQTRLLGGDLTGQCLIPIDDDRHGYDVVKGRVPLARLPHEATSYCIRNPNAGLYSALKWRAEQAGIRLRRQVVPGIRPLAEPTNLASLWFSQIAWFVHSQTLGRIGVPKSIKPEFVIGDLAHAYPGTKFVVLGNHVRQLDRIRGKLQGMGVHAVINSSRTPLVVPDDVEDDELPQMICSTTAEAGNINLATTGIVLVLDANKCQQERMQLALAQINAQFRLFGFTDSDRMPAPSEIDAAFAVFGPKLLELHGTNRARREAHVAWIGTPPPNNSIKKKAPEFAQKCYWHHPRRNRRVRQLATALRAGGPIDSQVFGDVALLYGDRGYQPPNVAILVDRPFHAVELSVMLPDWPIVVGDDALLGMRGSFRSHVRRFRRQWTTGAHQIVLADSAQQFRGETSDVVIWAGGGEYIDAIPRPWLSSEYDLHKPLLIVDFVDGHNIDAQKLSCKRQQAYLDRDIYPVGISAAQGRLAKFLHRQPAGGTR